MTCKVLLVVLVLAHFLERFITKREIERLKRKSEQMSVDYEDLLEASEAENAQLRARLTALEAPPDYLKGESDAD